MAVASAISVITIAMIVWFFASMSQLTYRASLDDVQTRTQQAVTQLQQAAMVLRTSEMREQIAAFNRLNESLVGVQGWLKLYSLQGSVLKWWAIVPENLTSNVIQELGAQTIGTNEEGLIIANGKDSVMRKGQQNR
jgi:hypothetical protein